MTLTIDRKACLRRAALGLAAVTLALGACGQSGPLYLPGNPSRIQVENPDAAPDAETDEIIESDESETRE